MQICRHRSQRRLLFQHQRHMQNVVLFERAHTTFFSPSQRKNGAFADLDQSHLTQRQRGSPRRPLRAATVRALTSTSSSPQLTDPGLSSPSRQPRHVSASLVSRVRQRLLCHVYVSARVLARRRSRFSLKASISKDAENLTQFAP